MMNSLDALIIAFFAMSVISIVGVLFLFLTKSEKVKKGIFYFLALWGLVIAYCNILTIPDLWTGSFLVAGGLGFLAIAAVLLKVCGKKENRFQIAQILVAVSVLGGMLDTFII